MNIQKLIAGTILAFSLSLAGTAANAFLLDFGVESGASQDGAIGYDGLGGNLVGSGINVDTLDALQTNANQGQYDLFNGELNFETGPLTNYTEFGPVGKWDFSGGGYIELTGGVDLNQNGIEDAGDIASGSVLFSGEFERAVVIGRADGGFEVALSFFDSQMNAEMMDFFGIPVVDANGNEIIYSGAFNISFLADVDGLTNGFDSGVVLSGDIVVVPAPGTLLLLGIGLLGMGGMVRSKRNKAA